jgi:hypothetical protein
MLSKSPKQLQQVALFVFAGLVLAKIAAYLLAFSQTFGNIAAMVANLPFIAVLITELVAVFAGSLVLALLAPKWLGQGILVLGLAYNFFEIGVNLIDSIQFNFPFRIELLNDLDRLLAQQSSLDWKVASVLDLVTFAASVGLIALGIMAIAQRAKRENSYG